VAIEAVVEMPWGTMREYQEERTAVCNSTGFSGGMITLKKGRREPHLCVDDKSNLARSLRGGNRSPVNKACR
jgi:hypothetical protein